MKSSATNFFICSQEWKQEKIQNHSSHQYNEL